jgi:hypothetical protein
VVCVDWEPVSTKATGGPGNPVSVTWTIGTANWAFPANQLGIVIDSNQKKSGSSGNQQWSPPVPSASSYSSNNKKENGNKKYQYTINVVNVTGGVVYLLTWDPSIMN